MPGTHYTLDRDRPENQNPMDLVKEKACERCGTVKPNDFRNFGKKLWKTRHDLTTTDVCIACQKKKVSDSMKAKWKSRKGLDEGYQAEQLRMARTIYEASEAAKAKAEKAAQEDAERNPGVKRLDLADALDLSDTGKEYVDHQVEPTVMGRPPKERVETASEVLMREFLSKN